MDGRRIENLHITERSAVCFVVIDAYYGQMLRNGPHLRRHPFKTAAIKSDKQIKLLLAAEAADGNYFFNAVKEPRFAKRVYVGDGFSLVASVVEKLHKRKHTAERIAVRA
jgi:hypothetical protein